MPESTWNFLKKSIKKEWIVCFFAAFLFGIAAHLYKFMNFLPNWDSLVNFHNNQDTTYLGRCFLHIVCTISSYYDLPWVNGLLSLIYLSLCAVCISELFSLKKTVSLILTGGLFTTFPSVTSTLAYNYTADGYFAALLCICLAVLLLVKTKRGFFPASLLIMFSLGIYQAYITFAVLLILFYLLDMLFFQLQDMKAFWKTGFRCLGGGLLGCILYWLALKLILLFSGTQLSQYQNVQSAFSLKTFHLIWPAKQCIHSFLDYFFDFSQEIRLFPVLNILLSFIAVFCLIFVIYKEKLFRQPLRLFLGLLCIALLPFAAYALYFQSSIDYHSLMVMGNGLFYLFAAVLYERTENFSGKVLAIRQWSILGLGSVFCFFFILTANVSYQKMQMAYEKSYAAVLRMADRIEQLPEADSCSTLAVIGGLPGANQASSVDFPPVMTGITDQYITWGQDEIFSMLQDYFGFSYLPATSAMRSDIEKTSSFQSMPFWPASGSIAVIQGTLVIHLPESILNDREDMKNGSLSSETINN